MKSKGSGSLSETPGHKIEARRAPSEQWGATEGSGDTEDFPPPQDHSASKRRLGTR